MWETAVPSLPGRSLPKAKKPVAFRPRIARQNRWHQCAGIARGPTLKVMQTLYGLHPVEEALKAGKRRFDHVLVARERRDDRLEAIVSLCKDLKIRVRTEPRETLTDLARTPAHQGVVAIVRAQQFLTIEDVLEPVGEPRLVLALDGVEDPQNLGALLRSADGAGVDSVVMTERRAAPLSAVA